MPNPFGNLRARSLAETLSVASVVAIVIKPKHGCLQINISHYSTSIELGMKPHIYKNITQVEMQWHSIYLCANMECTFILIKEY